MAIDEGREAPDFEVDSSLGRPLQLRDFRGRWVILYFYPKDDTPGCTKQACSFRDSFRRLDSLGCVVIGCSPDDLKAHDRFIARYDLPFVLASDADHSLADSYGVWIEKQMYGKKIMGIERTTFLIDPEGIIRKVWPKVKVEGHVDEILDELRAATA